MFAVLLDFNGTMFFDSSLHMEAWSKLYQDLFPGDPVPQDSSIFCGGCNDVILQKLAPWLTTEEREKYSQKKERGIQLPLCLAFFFFGLEDRGFPF